MVSQARAEATRHAIVVAAVEQFEKTGYGNTALSDIIDDAHITKGGFYYHFHTKEELAAGIIEHANEALGAALSGTLASPSPMLENLIRATFVVAEMMHHDNVVRMGFQLRQALNQVSTTGQSALVQRREVIVEAVKSAIAEGDLNEDLDAEEVGHTIWASILGTHLLAGASDDDIFARLAQLWRVILPGVGAPGSLPYFRQFVDRMERHHTQAEPSGEQ